MQYKKDSLTELCVISKGPLAFKGNDETPELVGKLLSSGWIYVTFACWSRVTNTP